MTVERPEDARERYKIEYGERLGSALQAFEARLRQLHRRWRDYDCLYSSDLSVSVLNKAAPAFFSRHQQMTFECVVMALAKLTDPERTGKLENLSVLHLLSLVERTARAKLQPFADDARAKAEFARDWRNKHFAHYDLKDALNEAGPLAPVKHPQVDEAIVALNKFVEQLRINCGGYSVVSALDHYYRSNDLGGAAHLLGYLHEANRANDQRLARIKTYKAHPEDKKDENDAVWKYLRKQ